MLLHQMVEAGCRFGPDDLGMDEWMGLSALRRALESDAVEAVNEKRRGRRDDPDTLQITPGR